MDELRLYAVTDKGAKQLVVPDGATDFLDLYRDLALGTYSALRTFDHDKFLHLEWHIERTKRSMDLMGMSYRWDEERFRRALHEVVSAFPAQDTRVRFDLLMQEATAVGSSSRELIALKTYKAVPKRYYERGVGADYAPKLQRDLALAKTAEFAEQRSHFAPGKDQDHYEYLMLDDSGLILEGTMTNFWAVRDGEVWTAGTGMLEGVTRKIILTLLPQLGIPLRLEAVSRDAIGELQEAAISGSSRAVMPVVSIDGEMVGDGRPGLVFERILKSYREYVTGEVKTAVDGLD